MRIQITGGSGAGKSTLARDLASYFGVAFVDVDAIAYVDHNWTKRALADRLSTVHEVAAQDSWIAAAGHLGWTAELSKRAEIILWLDPPLHVLLWRVTKRYLRSRPAGSGVELRRLIRVYWVWNTRWYFRRYRPGVNLDNDNNLSRDAIRSALSTHGEKTVKLRDSPTLADVVRLVDQHLFQSSLKAIVH